MEGFAEGSSEVNDLGKIESVNPARRTIGRRIRLALALFAVVASALMVITVFSPLVRAGEAEYGEIAPSGSSSQNSSAITLNRTKDPPALVTSSDGYERPHGTRSSFTGAEPVLREAANLSQMVIANADSSCYSYKTQFGTYKFSKSSPWELQLFGQSGERLASSSFGVESDLSAVVGKVEKTYSDSSDFMTVQSLLFNGMEFSKLYVKTEFHQDARPKITAWVNFTAPMGSHWVSIVWNVLLNQDEVRLQNTTPINGPQIASSALKSDNATQLETGFSLGDLWMPKCTVDWSDAKCGNTSLSYGFSGLFARIEFPSNMTYIDPTIVGPSTVDFATPGSPFRNVVYYEGTYWLFYYNGVSIVYSRSTDGGLSWSPATALPCSENGIPVANAFDVAIQGNHIAVTWLCPGSLHHNKINFIDGYISGSGINWNSKLFVDSISDWGDLGWFGGCALSQDGDAYVSYSDDRLLGSNLVIQVFTVKKERTNNYFSQSFSGSFGPYDLPDDETDRVPIRDVLARVVVQPDGGVLLVAVENIHYLPNPNGHQAETLIHWDIYHPSIGAWESSVPWTANLGGNDWRIFSSRDFSVCAGKSNETHIAMKKVNGFLFYIKLQQTDGATCSQSNLSDRCERPSISVDSSNDLHIYYINRASKVNETHTGPGGQSGWSLRGQVFSTESDSPAYLASCERLTERQVVSYVDVSTNPRGVMFGSIPLPADTTGAYSDPWSAGGVNQDQPFASGVSDVISPGNGLLYLFQTDFSVPGRGMDMTASRFFATPQYFVSYNSLYQPYLYYQFPFCNIGEGWQLNLPWIDSSYVHLWGGTKVAIEWDESGMTFNNTKGQPFVLTRTGTDPVFDHYLLDLHDGMRVAFQVGDGRPYEVYSNRFLGQGPDLTLGYNEAPGSPIHASITYLRDNLGRQVNFSYVPNPSIKLIATEFGGKTVSFQYDGDRLASTIDPLGRSTIYSYYDSQDPSLLIQSVTYPTGGTSSYEYDSISVGTEAIAKVVSSKCERPYSGNDEGHTIQYSYTAIDGAIKYTQIDDYNSAPRPQYKGSTEYNFDSAAKNTVVTYFTWNGLAGKLIPMKKTVSWYSPDGRISVAETYDDVNSPPKVAKTVVDSKANAIYTRDPMGHEVFSSFENTSTSNAFLRPASIDLNSSGKLFFDNFNDWVSDGWSLFGGMGHADIGNYLMDNSLDPSLRIQNSNTNQPFSYGVSFSQSQSEPRQLVLDCIVDMQAADPMAPGQSKLLLSNTASDAITGVEFGGLLGGQLNILYLRDGGWYTARGYTCGHAYRVTLCTSQSGSAYHTDFYLDGVFVMDWQTAQVYGGIPLKFFRIEFNNSGVSSSVVIDNLKIFRNWDVTINGLNSGMSVELIDSSGKLVSREKIFTGSQALIVLNSTHSFIPFSCFIVRNQTGVADLIDSYREVWGGDVMWYSKPCMMKSATSKVSSGLANGAIYTCLDDSLPASYYSNTADFNWVTDDLAILGQKYHHDVFTDTYGNHSYSINAGYDGPGNGPGTNGYFIQWVYLPPDKYPTEIGLGYFFSIYDQNIQGWKRGWTDTAYWGANAIPGVLGPRMGDLPPPGQWSMLVIKKSDVDWWNRWPVFASVGGVNYLHFGGDPYWDWSGCSYNADFTKIKVTGLLSNQSVVLKRSDGSTLTTGMTIPSTNYALLNLYGAGVTCYPVSASFTIMDGNGKINYSSPLCNDIFPSDVYSFSRTSSPFYSNPTPPKGFDSLPIGMMQSLSKTSQMESYIKYGFSAPGGGWDQTFLQSEQKVKNGTGWLKTAYQYDQYGNVIKTTDPSGAALRYRYTRSGTYLDMTWAYNGSQVNNQTILTYYEYYNNGLLRNQFDPLSRVTHYDYDAIGRITRITKPLINGQLSKVQYNYDDVNLTETFYDENGTKRVTYYDGYGRPFEEDRFAKDGSYYSWRDYYFGWSGRVGQVCDGARYAAVQYDYLGRVTKSINSDGTYSRSVYDDKNNTVVTYDEVGGRKDLVYDAADRLIQSVQYLGSTKVFVNTTYDEIGNVLNITDCSGTTRNEYDNLGRVTHTHSASAADEYFWYDNCGRLVKRQTADGWVVYYKYDAIGRMWKWYSGSSYVLLVYDKDSNIRYANRSYSGVVNVARSYDAWDRLVYENTTFDSTTYRLKYGYDNRSNVVSLDVKDGTYKLSYSYDEFNREKVVKDVTGTPFTIATFAYNDQDQVTSVSYGDGVQTTYSLNPNRGWIDRIQTSNGGTTLLDLAYARDGIGRITTVNGGRTFMYDGLGRLTYANDTAVYGTFAFTYDRAGNRLSQTWGSVRTDYGYWPNGFIAYANTGGATNITYGYGNDPSRLYTQQDSKAKTFSYDVNGLLTTVNVRKGNGEQFVYDAFNRRVKSVENTVTERIIYSGSAPIYNKTGTQADTLEVYVGGMHVAKKTGSTFYYFHEDALGSTRVVTKKQGSSVVICFQTDYLPFGKPYGTQYTEDFKFLDAKTTKVSGLIHFGARYYDPDIGRFISADSVVGALSSPVSMNRWAYCMNDPVNRVDLTGEFSFKSICNFVAPVFDSAASLVGDGLELLQDTATQVIEFGIDLVNKGLDVAQKFVDDSIDACLDVAKTIYNGVQSIQQAWDNLDPGLKQWIIMGVSMAVSFIPVAGPLISCIMDGTFVDMWNAIQRGDWGMLALSCAAFAPGMKQMKTGLKAFEKSERLIGKIGKYGALRSEVKVAGLSKELRVHHIVEQRFAEKLGKTPSEIPCVIITKEQHQLYTNAWRAEIEYGMRGTGTATSGSIREAAAKIYGEDSDLFKSIEHLFG